MKNSLLLSALLLAHPGFAAEPQDPDCSHDRDGLLSLDEQAFDQDLSGGGGGWRRIGNVPGCERTAAELIGAYRARHGNNSSALMWHEGQLWAEAGENELAIPLLEGSKKDAVEDPIGWNHYVAATVAFLRKDQAGLEEAREALSRVEYVPRDGLPPLKDGYIEVSAQEGSCPSRCAGHPTSKEGLLKCFDKPYGEAYGPSCRPATPASPTEDGSEQ